MNRIEAIFDRLRSRGDKALMPFITAGDPDLDTTGQLLPAMERAGASICELGIPFSDPIADGPVIQASMTRALERGVRPRRILEMVDRHRADLNMGLVAMVSYSIVYRLGGGSFYRDCRDAGFDGLIIPDLPLEEAREEARKVRSTGLTCSFLIAPNTSPQRAEEIAKICSGFVYVLSRAGLTGEQTVLATDLPRRIKRLRNITDLPIAVGFGISSPRQVAQVTHIADAAIVGSAIVRRIARVTANGEHSPRNVVAEVEPFVSELAGGLATEKSAGTQ